MIHTEALLSARLFLEPQLLGDRIFYISNFSGHLSLYVMDYGGSVPEPLLPPEIALQNPTLMMGKLYTVFPHLGKILVMIDKDGDENYQPMFIPIDGGYPEPLFEEQFNRFRVNCIHAEEDSNTVYFVAESRDSPIFQTYKANLEDLTLYRLIETKFGGYPIGINKNQNKWILIEAYNPGDHVVYLYEADKSERKLLYGTPLENRDEDEMYPPNSISIGEFIDDDNAMLLISSLHDDKYSMGYLNFAHPQEVLPVSINGLVHQGVGELVGLEHLEGDRYTVEYNIDGCSWLYEGTFDRSSLTFSLDNVLCGQGIFSNGVLKSFSYDKTSERFSFSFTTSTHPTQLYTVEGKELDNLICHTRERILGISPEQLSLGEDASFVSYDGLRISARLYLPSPNLSFKEPYPVVFYIHGGPQSQELPDFAWFSMPLIQLLTMNGFAVFVPNVRGSTGYGYDYMNRVTRDWGGKDRLDHVHALTVTLKKDKRIDTTRAAVVGRSYGGYMTLTLAFRHPELWNAAVDMFGPYNLLTFTERTPATWKTYFDLLVGDPEKDRDLLIERSPRTYIDGLKCPLMVIQGKNDPRVAEIESRHLVEEIRSRGKLAKYILFENEGHDVLKFENRVRCYNEIVAFFKEHLNN